MMERLTYRDSDGRAHLTIHGARMYCSVQATADCIAELEENLAAYKDTGMEPEEVFALQMHPDHAYADYVKNLWKHIGRMNRMEQLANAESEERLLVLPCKVGDTVYAIKNREIYATAVIGFRVHEWTGLWVLLLFDERETNGSYELRIDDFGKTVFTIREEAEAALKEESV